MLCSVCGDPLYPGEGVYSFEDPNDDEKEYIFCSLKCLEEYFGIEEWCVGQMTEKITKSWIEKAIHQKAVDRFEKEIIKTGLSLSRSILKDLEFENEPADDYYTFKLRDLDHEYTTAKRVEAIFKTNFKDYDNFRIEKIAEYEKEETNRLLSSIDGLKDFIEDRETRW